MKNVIFVALALGLLFSGCKSQKSLTTYAVLNGEWSVIELNGRSFLPEEKKPILVFNVADNRVSGNAGCNMITGIVECGKADALKFSGVASTRKMCLDMSAEDAFLKALNQVASYTADTPNTVTFYTPDKQKLFVISK